MTREYDSDKDLSPPRQHGDKVAAALRDQQNFNRGQVAWLMSQAMRWGHDLGYEAGYQQGQRDELALATVAAEYANRHPFSAQETVNSLKRRQYREACDAAARLPRPGDFRGRGTPPLRRVA